ncbi:hypothetical protein VIGAN_11159400, partial [Vigna angularis var. angularis]
MHCKSEFVPSPPAQNLPLDLEISTTFTLLGPPRETPQFPVNTCITNPLSDHDISPSTIHSSYNQYIWLLLHHSFNTTISSLS